MICSILTKVSYLWGIELLSVRNEKEIEVYSY